MHLTQKKLAGIQCTLVSYSPMISTLIFASSNNGCTCSMYILQPSFLPPIGFINTNNLFGRLNPEKNVIICGAVIKTWRLGIFPGYFHRKTEEK